MKKILVTGANGQLGRCIKDASINFPELDFIFASREELAIDDDAALDILFSSQRFDYCINAAAYTDVEKAESESDKAFLINAEAVRNLAIHCKKNSVTLIQISTDYVFDGEKTTPYTEEDPTNPLNVYGASKLKGEQYIQEICEAYFILRTSWLYSQYGHNFFNSMLRFAKEGRNLKITTEQTGTPTNANDLAKTILTIISKNSKKHGIYNFSNSGETTWYHFAKAILQLSKQFDPSKLAKTDHYRTFAARPKYSVLNNNALKEIVSNSIDWETSLKTLINNTVN